MARPVSRYTRKSSDWEFITHAAVDPLLDLSRAQSHITAYESADARFDQDAYVVIERNKPSYSSVAALQCARSSLSPSPSPALSPLSAPTTASAGLSPDAHYPSPLVRLVSALSLTSAETPAAPEQSRVLANGAYLDIRLKKSGKHYVARR